MALSLNGPKREIIVADFFYIIQAGMGRSFKKYPDKFKIIVVGPDIRHFFAKILQGSCANKLCKRLRLMWLQFVSI